MGPYAYILEAVMLVPGCWYPKAANKAPVTVYNSLNLLSSPLSSKDKVKTQLISDLVGFSQEMAIGILELWVHGLWGKGAGWNLMYFFSHLCPCSWPCLHTAAL